MELGQKLKECRLALNKTQQQMATELYVTRQTVSHWENNDTYPSLDMLVTLSDYLGFSLDTTLKEEGTDMIDSINKELTAGKRYKKIVWQLAILASAFLFFIAILTYGRATQNQLIDRFNPFLKETYGYALLPEKVATKKVRGTQQSTDANGKTTTKKVVLDMPQPVDAYVYSDIFGAGEWLKFQVGTIPKGYNYAVVLHKGSYVKRARLITKGQVPTLYRSNIGSEDQYLKYDKKNFGPRNSINPFSNNGV
ncbi:helix-turn-helix domain-containing protein [Leuconostoc mesenteroides]|uniref:helix-turn-helix domain-containing protein n=1 Tax=Leuconostoc mesenteroides TaxID=1245 RepID=UPI00385DB11D